MGCFIGLLGLLKRSKRGLDDPTQRDAAAGHRSATALERRRGGAKSSETAVLGFDLEGLLSAPVEVLGRGRFGTTYKANLELGEPMIVKRLEDFIASVKGFQEIVDAMDSINHQNLLPLTASYNSLEDKLLVYEFLPMGSLYDLLHGNHGSGGKSPLNWGKRIRVALGVARAIAHIHSQSPTKYHGHIKSSNVMLTRTLEARVSDYGLAEYGPSHFAQGAPAANGVDGYRAPGVIQSDQVSQKADVYSFGVLFLELLTGKDPTESYLKDEGMDLSGWMRSAVEGEWTSEVFDVEVLRHENVEMLMQYLELAFSWTARDPDMRPSMVHVITQIRLLCCYSSDQV